MEWKCCQEVVLPASNFKSITKEHKLKAEKRSATQFVSSPFLANSQSCESINKQLPPKPPQLDKPILAHFDAPSTRKLNKTTTQPNRTQPCHHPRVRRTPRCQDLGRRLPNTQAPSRAPARAETYGTGDLSATPHHARPPGEPRSGTYWSVGTMPEGCLDRSTGWLPSSPGSAIRIARARDAAEPAPIRGQIRGRNGREGARGSRLRDGFRNSGSFIEIGGGVGEEGRKGRGARVIYLARRGEGGGAGRRREMGGEVVWWWWWSMRAGVGLYRWTGSRRWTGSAWAL
jgi:hypothetical protein